MLVSCSFVAQALTAALHRHMRVQANAVTIERMQHHARALTRVGIWVLPAICGDHVYEDPQFVSTRGLCVVELVPISA